MLGDKGTIAPTSKLEIAAQDGLAITGYNPFLTLRDTNAGNARGVIQGVNGGLNLFANSYLVGTNPTAFLRLDDTGNVGIGTAVPTFKLHVDGGDGNAVYRPNSWWINGVYGSRFGGIWYWSAPASSSYRMDAYSENNDALIAQTNHPDHAAVVARNLYSTGYALMGNSHTSVEAYAGSSTNDLAIYASGPSQLSSAVMDPATFVRVVISLLSMFREARAFRLTTRWIRQIRL